ncbi:MAG: sulfatase activating formylglycine-generating enzyme [Myxococcota bacterium]|jgi:formylglycine-generating enzyme required for sulfatase activity
MILLVAMLSASALAACPEGRVPHPTTDDCVLADGTRQEMVFGYALRFVGPRAGTLGSGDLEGSHERDEPFVVVRMSRGWWIGETEVTQAQWAEVVSSDPEPDPRLPQAPWHAAWNDANLTGDQHPVQGITWCDAVRFANAASRVARRQPAYYISDRCEKGGPVVPSAQELRPGFRLPTEVEWELTARAAGAYPWGVVGEPQYLCGVENLRDGAAATVLGWEADVPCTDGFAGTAPVGALATHHPFGIADLLGNVREWCYDGYGGWPSELTDDPQPTERGTLRAVRGGSWRTSSQWARVANRQRARRTHAAEDLGLRLALDPRPTPLLPAQ